MSASPVGVGAPYVCSTNGMQACWGQPLYKPNNQRMSVKERVVKAPTQVSLRPRRVSGGSTNRVLIPKPFGPLQQPLQRVHRSSRLALMT